MPKEVIAVKVLEELDWTDDKRFGENRNAAIEEFKKLMSADKMYSAGKFMLRPEFENISSSQWHKLKGIISACQVLHDEGVPYGNP